MASINLSCILITFCLQMMMVVSFGNGVGGTSTDRYWHERLPNTAMPIAIRDYIVSDLHNFSFWNMGSDGDLNNFLIHLGKSKYENDAEDVDMSKYNNVTIFFLLDDFQSGMKLTVDASKSTNYARILPRQFAEAIPFSCGELPEILKTFSIDPESGRGTMITKVLEGCKSRIRGEQRKCVTSVEDMIDFSVAHTGSNVGIFTNDLPEINEKANVEEYSIAGIRKVGEKAVVCHKSVYPYAVYYCHTLDDTTVFIAGVRGSVSGTKGKMVVVCHSDTSAWSPNNIAFKFVNTKPGEATVCHVIQSGSLVWVSLQRGSSLFM